MKSMKNQIEIDNKISQNNHHNFLFRILETKVRKLENNEPDACYFFDTFGLAMQATLLVVTLGVLLCKLN